MHLFFLTHVILFVFKIAKEWLILFARMLFYKPQHYISQWNTHTQIHTHQYIWTHTYSLFSISHKKHTNTHTHAYLYPLTHIRGHKHSLPWLWPTLQSFWEMKSITLTAIWNVETPCDSQPLPSLSANTIKTRASLAGPAVRRLKVTVVLVVFGP